METLKEKLTNFSYEGNNVDDLTKKFAKLAPYFLYGGYICIHDRFIVYIRRIEFYFHCESDGGIKDDIVYHRNNPEIYPVGMDLPYFEPISFHAHTSGIDIAFENKHYSFRASALIRAYEIYDKENGKYLEVINGKWNYSDLPAKNSKSLYLYDIFNGFGNNKEIEWIDAPSIYLANHKELILDKRENVYLISKPKVLKDGSVVPCKWDKPEYKEPRERKWSFERQEFIPISII